MLDPLPPIMPTELPSVPACLGVDDEGHAADVAESIRGLDGALRRAGWQLSDDLAWWAMDNPERLRDYLAQEFFADHLKHYSCGGRSAPIYWQLATASASYSVWLYMLALSKDTLYKVQNEYVVLKLSHEERQLERVRAELGPTPNAADRRGLAAQEVLVDELRAFLDEVKRVAPLWNPHLDDGVIINFAPLWRLVPHHKSWQKELKTTWDALCAGDYEWAHLAMHLWPERVVPKCATDRSLAIAHGLEDVFWTQGGDGKWKARTTPVMPVDQLVRARSSPAVTAALKSLVDAPTAPRAGQSRGRRAAFPVATEGGSR